MISLINQVITLPISQFLIFFESQRSVSTKSFLPRRPNLSSNRKHKEKPSTSLLTCKHQKERVETEGVKMEIISDSV